MGMHFQFECARCGFSAEVSGGDDAGMEILTTTILCEDCIKLYDVVTGKAMELQDTNTRPPRCPKSQRHKIRPWKAGGPCPACGEPLENKGETCLWD